MIEPADSATTSTPGTGRAPAQKVSILVPIFNEIHTLSAAVRRMIGAPLPPELAREIILVDDASTDGSRELAGKLARQFPEVVRAFYHEKNRGKGAAIRTAIPHATGELIVFHDADLEYDPHDLERLINPLLLGYADVVYGSRFAARDERRVLLYRHNLANQFLTFLSNWFTNLNLTDMETGYKAFTASALRSIPIRSNRFGIEPEITAKVAHRRLRVYEIPINYHGRDYTEGKKIRWYHGMAALWTILKYAVIQDCYQYEYGEEILSSLAGVNNFVRWMVERVEPFCGERLLEVGSGIGNITHEFPRRELIIASDIDDSYLDQLRKQLQYRDYCKVVKLDITKQSDFQPLQQDHLDTILCLNVLEHVEDDQTTLNYFHEVLVPGGRIVVLAPQYQWAYGEYDRVLGHCRRYSKALLRERMQQAGFQVEETLNFNFVSLPGWYLGGKVLKRKRFSRLQLKLFNMIVPVAKFVERILRLPGQSLIMVGRKPAQSKHAESSSELRAGDGE